MRMITIGKTGIGILPLSLMCRYFIVRCHAQLSLILFILFTGSFHISFSDTVPSSHVQLSISCLSYCSSLSRVSIQSTVFIIVPLYFVISLFLTYLSLVFPVHYFAETVIILRSIKWTESCKIYQLLFVTINVPTTTPSISHVVSHP